jgi:hypothetical protein
VGPHLGAERGRFRRVRLDGADDEEIDEALKANIALEVSREHLTVVDVPQRYEVHQFTRTSCAG